MAFWYLVFLTSSFILPECHSLPAATLNRQDKMIDLTHPFAENFTISWPTAAIYDSTIVYRDFNEALGTWYEANNFAQAEHCGTHTDAPSHFAEGKWRLHEIPLERLVGPGVVINIVDRTR